MFSDSKFSIRSIRYTTRQHNVCTADLHVHNGFRTPFFSAPFLIKAAIEPAFCSTALTLDVLQQFEIR